MFETKGTLNEENLKEICNRFYPRWTKWLLVILMFYSVVKLMIKYANDDYIGMVINCVVIGILIILYFISKVGFNKGFFEVIDETCDNRELSYKVDFDENGVNINNLITGGQGSIAYSNMYKIFNMHRVIIIMCKSGQWFVVFTSCFTPDELLKFRKFIKEKCPKIKVV
ncbi:MAG: hypothetical protein RSC49_05900 [Clostridium sp.]